tara:strand:+ start:1924 stop:2208 length:285 start_codon:yes stop_codon:yes gene_type:complete
MREMLSGFAIGLGLICMAGSVWTGCEMDYEFRDEDKKWFVNEDMILISRQGQQLEDQLEDLEEVRVELLTALAVRDGWLEPGDAEGDTNAPPQR